VSVQRGTLHASGVCGVVRVNPLCLTLSQVFVNTIKGKTTDGNLKDMTVPLDAVMLLGLKFNPPDLQ
jgi:hypothetical protein